MAGQEASAVNTTQHAPNWDAFAQLCKLSFCTAALDAVAALSALLTFKSAGSACLEPSAPGRAGLAGCCFIADDGKWLLSEEQYSQAVKIRDHARRLAHAQAAIAKHTLLAKLVPECGAHATPTAPTTATAPAAALPPKTLKQVASACIRAVVTLCGDKRSDDLGGSPLLRGVREALLVHIALQQQRRKAASKHKGATVLDTATQLGIDADVVLESPPCDLSAWLRLVLQFCTQHLGASVAVQHASTALPVPQESAATALPCFVEWRTQLETDTGATPRCARLLITVPTTVTEAAAAAVLAGWPRPAAYKSSKQENKAALVWLTEGGAGGANSPQASLYAIRILQVGAPKTHSSNTDSTSSGRTDLDSRRSGTDVPQTSAAAPAPRIAAPGPAKGAGKPDCSIM